MTASIVSIHAVRGENESFPAQGVSAEHSSAEHSSGEASPRSAAKTRLRLTRRGRVVFGALATALLVGVLVAVAMLGGGARAFASAEEGRGNSFGYVVVQPGASLWQVASELDPSADPRDLVAEIVRLNQLGGSGVDAWQELAVPMRYADAPGVLSAEELGL